MKTNEKRRKGYKEILSAINSNIEVVEEDYQLDISALLESRIRALDLCDMFDIELTGAPLGASEGFCRINDYCLIARYGEAYRRTVSWSDDGSQPEDEWLYLISFPTGPYIFGEGYPEDVFKKFFNELKSYSPKYSDTNNKCLYFSPSKASAIHENFNSIKEKYAAMAREELKAKLIQKKKDEIKRLEKAS